MVARCATPQVDISALLTAVEDASPAEAMSVAADVLCRTLGVRSATFLIADAAGSTLVDPADPEGRFALDGTDPGVPGASSAPCATGTAGRTRP